MSKHTPGPWRFVDDPNVPAIMSTVTDEWGNPYTVVNLQGAMGGENTEADAHLLTAAPELLDALQAILGPLADVPLVETGHESEQRPTQPNLRVSGAALVRARVAIRKARGRCR